MALDSASKYVSKLSNIPRRTHKALCYKLADLTARPEPRPVFFLGNPKSGTTAIAALFAIRTGRSFSSDMCFHRRWLDAGTMLRGGLTIAELRRRGPAEFGREVIKDPFFSFAAPELRRLYPDSPLFFIIRNPFENIRSILNRLSIPGHLEELQPTHHKILEKLPLWRCYFDKATMDSEKSHYIDLLAQAWQRCVDNAATIWPEGCHLIYYEDFVESKKSFLDDLVTRAGLEVRQDVSSYVDTQFQPKGDRSVGISEFFGDNRHRVAVECSRGIAWHGYALAG